MVFELYRATYDGTEYDMVKISPIQPTAVNVGRRYIQGV